MARDYVPRMKRLRTDSKGSAASRLIDAAARLAAEGGVKAVTTRAAAQAAGTSASAVTTALGGRQELLVAVFEHARAQALARDQAALADLSGLGLTPCMMGDWLSAYLYAEAHEGRGGLLLRREMYLQVGRIPELLPTARLWRDQDLAFARAVLELFGVDAEKAGVLVEGLHALVGLFPVVTPSISRTAWAEQAIRHFCARLCETSPPSAPWRPLIEARAGEMAASFYEDDALSPQAELILEAAVRLLAHVGAAGLSHRQLASEAGVPLSATTYYFKNREAILEATFKRVYSGLASEAREITPQMSAISIDQLSEASSSISLDAQGGLSAPMVVIDELLAAAFRDPELEPFAAHILSSRGQTTALILPHLTGVTLDDWVREDAFLLSLLGLSSMSALQVLPAQARSAAARDFYRDRLLTLLPKA
jgi:DNA-binding transcriptional regulator YbjK